MANFKIHYQHVKHNHGFNVLYLHLYDTLLTGCSQLVTVYTVYTQYTPSKRIYQSNNLTSLQLELALVGVCEILASRIHTIKLS